MFSRKEAEFRIGHAEIEVLVWRALASVGYVQGN